MCAPFVVEGGLTTAVFETYVARILVPSLHPGDMVILDNLAVHKSARVRGMLSVRGVKMLSLPAYSPDLSPIENASARLKTSLCRVCAQTLDTLIHTLANALDTISPYDAIGLFVNAGLFNLDQ